MTDFWIIGPRGGTAWTWLEPTDLSTTSGEPEWPELRWDVARGDFTQLAEPLAFTVDRRGKLADLLWSTGGPYKIASTRLVTLLEDLGATGWTSTPLGITCKNGGELDGYHLLAVTGSCDGLYDNYDPATKWLEHEMWMAKGIDVTVGWDGTDLFWTRGKASRQFIVTDRVATAFKQAGLAGIEFTPSTEFVVIIDDELSRN